MTLQARYLVDLSAGRTHTPLADVKSWQLGPRGESDAFDPTSLRPYMIHESFAPNVTIPSFARSGWGGHAIIGGSATIAGLPVEGHDFAISSPYGFSGEIVTGPEGLVILSIVDSGQAVATIFEVEDARTIEHNRLLGYPEQSSDVTEKSTGTGWTKLDKSVGLVESGFALSNVWEVGPGALESTRIDELGVRPAIFDAGARPIIGFADVASHMNWPDHVHGGYSSLYLYKGTYFGGYGPDFHEGELEITTPVNIVSSEQHPGPEGTKEIIFFDSAHGSMPIALEDTDQARGFLAAMGV